MNILKVENVSFSYDNEKYVLKDINMEFEPNKTYGVFGKSGAGKTTLLSLIAGLETTKQGTIYFKDIDISKINRDQYRSNDIGVIFQSFNLLPHLTAVENIILSMDISNKKVGNQIQNAYQLLKKVGLDVNKANRKILQLSGGEQQRVAIARALSYDSDIILADEPTGNLDHETEEDIINLLISLAKEDNKCVIIISHSNSVKQKVDVVYHLVNGKLK